MTPPDSRGIETTCPSCEVTIYVPGDTPPGVYRCPNAAHQHRLRLAWDTYLHGGRKPRLTLEEDSDG